MTRRATSARYIDSFSPWWNSELKSFSPISFASWSFALKSAAVKRREGRRIEVRALADGRDELPGAIDEQRAARVAVREKLLQRRRDRAEIVFGEGPACSANGHRDPS